MSLGMGLGLAMAYYTWRATTAPKDSAFTAAIFGSLYWIAGLSAIFYPGTKFVDPEFQGEPQPVLFSSVLAVTWVGYFLEARRLSDIKSA
jgi:hypothetical protein